MSKLSERLEKVIKDYDLYKWAYSSDYFDERELENDIKTLALGLEQFIKTLCRECGEDE